MHNYYMVVHMTEVDKCIMIALQRIKGGTQQSRELGGSEAAGVHGLQGGLDNDGDNA